MKRYILVLFLFLSSSAYSQSTLNHYKYVIVPEKFSFQKQNDQYALNSSIKQFLENKGFAVFFDNTELPTEIANNKCAALIADLDDKSGMFTTKLVFTLKDCRGSIVFQSAVGTSREKEYEIGYNMALTDALSWLDKVSYTYNGANGTIGQKPVASAVATVLPAATENRITLTKVAKATETNQPVKTLYAQAIPNGYQLIDMTPKKVLTLLKTSAENYFIASNDAVSGIVLKINENWFFEYYSNNKLVSEKLLIKF